MRITFVGNFEVSYSSENHHARSLESLGHQVIRLQEGIIHGEVILEEALKSDCLIFVHTHGWVTPGLAMDQVFAQCKDANIPTLTYHLDLWLGLERQKDLETDPFYKTIGHFFTVDKLMADWFNENTEVKGHYIAAGVFGEECQMMTPQPVEYDIIFVGSKGYHPEWQWRPQLIEWLRNTYGPRFMHVGGDGDTGTVRGLALNQIYANAKIAVGDTLCLGFDYPYYFSDRLFECPGRGGFNLFPRIKGIENYYEPDKEIALFEFNNFGDLESKINYYLEHDDEREAIRLAGHKRTVADHTYKQRWAQILKEIA